MAAVVAGLTCSRLSCGDGERCLVNTLSATPVCYPCDRPCVRSGRRPVCASDGLTYDSRCQLDRAACRRGVVIEASRAGRCDNGECSGGLSNKRRRDDHDSNTLLVDRGRITKRTRHMSEYKHSLTFRVRRHVVIATKPVHRLQIAQ